jgi:glutathione synthase/RimK-type ligase-like ATP-grasp enzyme
VKPTVLIATTARWFPTTRLAMALTKPGFAVEAVCPSGHTLARTGAVRHVHSYRAFTPLASFANAITAATPDLVIPADDLAARHLHELYWQQRNNGKAGTQICELIERSLGAPESFETVYARTAFIRIAQEEGIRAPKTKIITDRHELTKWMAQMGFPTVLKANGTSGGVGVKVVNTVEEAEHAFRKLQAPPLIARAIKRALVDQDPTLVWPSLSRCGFVVNAQAFVAGREATSTIACWKGKILASLHFEVLKKTASTGHATVLRSIEHSEMADAAEKIARRFKLSGLHGLDFMLEAHTGNAHLIEINPRTTQVGHLSLGLEHDLPAAMYAALTGKEIQPVPKVTENETIALFPQEWARDPKSEFLQSAYHDVPWEEPELIRSCVRKGKQKTLRPGLAVAFSEDHRLSPMVAQSQSGSVRLNCKAE